jgi:hypothetical protein
MSEQEKIDAIHREKEMVMISRRAEEEAREHARMLLEWAEGKTLQRGRGADKWDDYRGRWYPTIYNVANWRIKPEPRTVWLADPSGSDLVHVATTPEQADELRKKHFVVTEWREVVS